MNRGSNSELKYNILVVDDTPANITLLTEILANKGYKVRVAPKGKLALQSVHSSPPDLILLDIKMQDMDGYEVCKHLKASEQTCNIPIIFISALDAPLDKVKAFTLGGVDYITKPIEPIEVLARIEHQLRLRQFQLQLQTRNAQLQLLLTTTQAISSADSVEEALEVILTNICQTLGWELGEAWMPNAEASALEYHRGWYVSDVRLDEFRRQSETFRFALGEGLPGRVWLWQELEWIGDVTQESDRVFLRTQIAAQAGLRGMLGIPIVFDHQVLAVLVFFHKQKMVLDERSLELVNAVATQLGSMIQRKKAEETVRVSQARFAGILEIAKDAIIAVDANQKITLFNQGAEKIFGYTNGEVVGQPLDLLLPDRFAASHRQHVAGFDQFDSKTSQTGERGEIFARRKDGTEFPAEASISKLEIGTEKIFTTILRDITERKQTEATLRQQAARERLIAELTQQMRQSLNLDEVLNTTVKNIRQCLLSDRVAIYQLKSDRSGIIVAESVGEGYSQMLSQTVHPFWVKGSLNDYEQGLPKVVCDIGQSDFPADVVEFLQHYQVKAILAVPILDEEDLWGLLIADHCAAPRDWQSFEVHLLQQLANQLAIAIHQSVLYQQVLAANRELRQLASLDGLTQIANRRRFDEYLNGEWKRLKREQAPLSLILLDVDFFKRYNDTYGHLAGDDCLRQVASTIKSVVKRPADLVARYGGEEFAVILPDSDIQGAVYIAEAIRRAVHNLAVPHAQSSVSDRVTVSLGVASLVPKPELSPQNLINIADAALYKAKKEGRDRVNRF